MHATLKIASLVAVVVVLPAIAPAQSPQQPNAAPAYRPDLGDLMTMTVQPRHLKLGLAGREKNWAFAAYELHELEEAFDRAGRVWPVWRSNAIPAMLEAVTADPVALLRAAVRAEDAGRFAIAYRQLTEACNVCHQNMQHGMIIIREPDASPYSNQDFRPSPR